MKHIAWVLQALAFYLFSLVVSCIPVRLVPSAGRLTGLVMYHLLARRRRIAVDNIRQALPHMRSLPEWNCPLETPEEIARETFTHICTSLVETCLIYHSKGEYLIEGVEIRGLEHYQAAKAQSKGIIFLAAHTGNWELGALACGRIFNESLSVVVRRQANPYLNRMVEKTRLHYNNRVIYKKNALRNIISVIRKNGAIGLLVDQATTPRVGIMMPFLGRMSWASKTPVLLSLKTGVAVLPTFFHREGDHHVMTFFPVCTFQGGNTDDEIARDVKAYSEYIERFITMHPTQWYWVHRRWKRADAGIT